MPNSSAKPLFLRFMASLNLFVEISRPQLHSWKFYRAQEEQKSAQNEYVYSECLRLFQLFKDLVQINLLKGSRGLWITAAASPRLSAPQRHSPEGETAHR